MELNEAQQQSFINKPNVCFTDKYLVDDTSVLLITWSASEQKIPPQFDCSLTFELQSSSKISTNDNLLVINSISSGFSRNIYKKRDNSGY